MKVKPLGEVGLLNHASALWWLWLLYRKPGVFKEELDKLSKKKMVRTGGVLLMHAIPGVVLFGLTARLILCLSSVEVPWREQYLVTPYTITRHLIDNLKFTSGGIFGGITFGIAFGIASGIIKGKKVGVAIGVTSGIMCGILLGFGIGTGFGVINTIDGGLLREILFGCTLGITIGIIIGIISGAVDDISGGIFGVVFGITGGIAFGVAYGISRVNTFGIDDGIFWGIIGGIAFGIAGGIAFGIGGGIAFGITDEKVQKRVFRIIGSAIAVGIVFGLLEGYLSGIDYGIALGISVWTLTLFFSLRIYYIFYHLIFFLPNLSRLYHLHPVVWDDMCNIPFPGLDRILVSYASYKPEAARIEIERLITAYPSQRMNALRAKTTLLINSSSQVSAISDLPPIIEQLPEGDKSFLLQVSTVKSRIAKLAQRQNYLDHEASAIVQEREAKGLIEDVADFRSTISGLREPLASGLLKAADAWLVLAKKQHAHFESLRSSEPWPQVFRAGDPVVRTREAFVPRLTVIEELQRQITLSTGCPGIILYARRRMGKSTLLKNLFGFLPPQIRVAFVSMQNPQAFTSTEALIRKLVETIAAVVNDQSSAPLPIPQENTLPAFYGYLTAINTAFEKTNSRLLIALDEYENIDLKLGDSTFSPDLLPTIRESIQSHRAITWLFSGSNEVTRLKHAEWSSYLISARTVDVPLFTLDETTKLLTDPCKHSDLFKDAMKRPQFPPEFWGTISGAEGIAAIQQQSGGWPHIVQLIAETLVDEVNRTSARKVSGELFSHALGKVILHGNTVFDQLVRGECECPKEWDYLCGFQHAEALLPPTDAIVRRSLLRRNIVIEENGQWRLRVPLMRKWLVERA